MHECYHKKISEEMVLKKIITAFILLICFSAQGYAQIYTPEEYNGAELLEDINFLSSNPLKTEMGTFSVKEEEPPVIVNYTFDDGACDKLTAESGIFEISDGKYIQKSTDSIVSKSMINEEVSDFTLEFDATAVSNASTMLLFLGSNNDGYYTFEYSYSGAVLRKNGTENIDAAECSFTEGETVHFSVRVSGGALEIKTGENEFLKTDARVIPPGKAGIGTWASSVAFDNLVMKRLSANGFDKKLYAEGSGEAAAFSDISESDVRVSANIMAESFISSRVGIILRGSYLFCVDGKYAYICKADGDGFKAVADAPVRVMSGEYFLIGARAEGEKLTLSVNNRDFVSAYADGEESGKCGIYKGGTGLYVNNIRLEKINGAELTRKMENDEHTASYNILSHIGVGDFSEMSKSVTRLDFAQYISKLLKFSPSEKAAFSDTDSPYALSVVKSGYMSAFDDGSFGADMPIKTLDAAKVITDICGYRNLALSGGGYPNGYKSAGASLNLTSGIDSEYLSASDAALLLLRGLFLERYEENTLSGSGKSIAEEMYSIKTISGICRSSSTGAQVGDGQIKIDDTVINADDCKAFEGRYVKAYYTDIKGDNTLIYAYKTKTEEYTVSSDDIADEDGLDVLKYYKNGSLKTERFDADTKIILNGEYLCTVGEALLPSYAQDQGSITVVKNKAGEDVVFINRFKIILAKRPVNSDDNVYDILTDTLISLKDTDIFSDSGEKISAADIEAYDTIKLYQSKEEPSRAYVSKCKSVQGKAEQIKEDKIYIEKNSYDYYINTGNIKNVKAGAEAIFYFDGDYKALYALNINSESYAYLAKAVYNSDESTVRLWLYSLTDGAMKCDASEKAAFYDYSVSSKQSKPKPEALYNALKDYSGIIRYKTNEKGEISSVSLPRIANKRDDPTNDGYFTRNFSKENCQQIFNTFYTRFAVTPSSLIVRVPQDRENLDAYEMMPYGSLMDDELYSVDIYDCSEKYEIGAAAVYSEPVYLNKPSGVVKEIVTSVDKNGNDVLGIVMFSQGGFKTVYAKEDILCDNDNAYSFGTLNLHVTDLKCGDIISFHTDSSGYLKDFITVFQNKENQDYYRTSIKGWWSENVPHQTLAMGYAQVEKVFADRFYIKMFYGTVNCISKGGTSYCIYDKKSKQPIRAASIADLQEGDSIVCVWNNSVLNNVVIYR